MTLAALLGYSAEWLRKVEREGRPVERVSTVLRLAEVLHIKDASSLVDVEGSAGLFGPRRPRTDHMTGAVRQALLRRQIPGETSAAAVAVGSTEDAISELWRTWRTSTRCYSATYQRLPGLIDGIGAHGDQQQHAEALRLVSSFLLRVGDTQFAQVAVDHALAELACHRDLTAWYSCVAQFSEVLLRAGSTYESRKLATASAARMRRRVDTGEEDLHALVHLILVAAEAAAAMSDHPGATALLDEAADLLTGDGAVGQDAPMSPAAAEIVAMRVALSMGRPERALHLADRAEGLHRLCLAGQSEFYLALAAAHLASDDLIATTFALMQVERICSEEIRFGVEARRLLSRALAEGTARTTVRHELCGLAERAGVL